MDTSPSKSVLVSTDPQDNSFTDTIISYFTYNTAGQRIADSVIEKLTDVFNPGTYKRIFNYQYANNMIYGVETATELYNPTGGTEDYTRRDTAQLDAKGNIISSRGKTILNSGVIYTTVSNITYDDKPSPFKKLSNFKTFQIFPSGETLPFEMPQNNNRLHTVEATDYGYSIYNYETDYTGKYTYNSNGYLAHIISTDPSDPNITEKAIFVYKML